MKHKNLHIVEHPLIQHKLSLLRDSETPRKLFRELLKEITLLIGFAATQHLPLQKQNITTPLAKISAEFADTTPITIVPILRAGLGMLDAFLTLIPWAKVGHIGLYRDENTAQPHNYFLKIPEDNRKGFYFICDPMLATGGSAVTAIAHLKKIKIKKITYVCVIAAPEGIKNLLQHHPDITIFTASIDQKLNKDKFIVPGLGDAGDRLYGTD